MLAFVFFILLYYNPLEACFLMRDRKQVDLDGRGGGEDLGVVEVGKR